MINLDNLKQIQKLDKSKMLGSIEMLARQCQQVWGDVKGIKLPNSYKKVDSIIVNGMGGSALGSHIIRSIYAEELKVPMRIIHSYSLPGSVNSKTLYIASSYSGNTEEVLATIKEAISRKAKVMIFAGGGELARIKYKYNLPGYIFDPKYNPCNQPRIGLGYSIFGQWLLLQKIGLLKLAQKEYKEIIGILDKLKNQLGIDKNTKNNLAKKFAKDSYGKIPIIISAEFLSGNAHTFSNQLNENAKNFSAYYLISEMNHHLLEGLMNPKTNSKNLHFILFESGLYHLRNQKRFEITKRILKKNNIGYSVYSCRGKNKAVQSFEVLSLGSFISFYLAMLNNIDPSPIPWVDYFKKQLS